MSMVSGVFNDYVVPAALSRPMVIGAGCIVAIPALELIKCIGQDYDVIQRYNTAVINESESAKSERLYKQDLLKNTLLMRGIGALILGACAFNLFPGSGAVGLLGYLTYSRFNWINEASNTNPCYSLVVPGIALQVLSAYKKLIAIAIISRIKITTLAIGSFIYKTAMKVGRFGLAILHGIRSTIIMIITPFKKLGNLLKIFKPFIRHPKLGLAFVASLVCLMGCVKYGHKLTGAAAVVVQGITGVVRGGLSTGTFIGQGIGKTIPPTIRFLGTTLSFVPTILVKTMSSVKAVVGFFFHPLQSMGITKAKASV
jgi:hypothetical protein